MLDQCCFKLSLQER